MIEYRRYRNTDPPRLVGLFLQAGLGRGASQPDSVALFEISTFSLPYFNPNGLIVACDGSNPIGFVHAGFGFNADLSALDHSKGVISCIIVHPEYRRRGIGRKLLAKAEEFLTSSGATQIQAGESKHCDPFYFGLYGGARPSGFLLTDPLASLFFQKCGYSPAETISVLQRSLKTSRDPTTIRLMSIRRATDLVITDQPEAPTWWWWTHFANIESMRFALKLRKTGEIVADLTVVGLDAYISCWRENAIGLVDVHVLEKYRGQGYGQTLLIETVRRLRGEMVTRAEIHVPDANSMAMKSATGAGFEKVDTGIVYRKTS